MFEFALFPLFSILAALALVLVNGVFVDAADVIVRLVVKLFL